MDLQPFASPEPSAPGARAIAVSVVLPMLNEAENAAPLIAEIAAALAGRRDCEIVCVDDGSSDGTADRLKAAMRTTPGLRLVRHSRRAGQSASRQGAKWPKARRKRVKPATRPLAPNLRNMRARRIPP